MISNTFVIKNIKFMGKNKYMKIYQGFGPTRHGRVGIGLCLRSDGPARHDPFLFYAVPSHAYEGTSPVGPTRHGPLVGYSSVDPVHHSQGNATVSM
jgi:hypothetical protein